MTFVNSQVRVLLLMISRLLPRQFVTQMEIVFSYDPKKFFIVFPFLKPKSLKAKLYQGVTLVQ